jgi:hypothetical protein
MPPRNAAVLGSSADGARTLNHYREIVPVMMTDGVCLHFSNGIIDALRKFNAFAYGALNSLAKAFSSWRYSWVRLIQGEQRRQCEMRAGLLWIGS